MKKIILWMLLLISTCFSSYASAAMHYVKVNSSYINVYGTWFDTFTQFEWTVGWKKLQFGSVMSSWHIQFLNQDDFLEWNLVVNWIKFNYTGSSVSKLSTSLWSVNIYKPLSIYVSYLWWTYWGNWYTFNWKFSWTTNKSAMDFYINDQKISETVAIDNNSFKFSYKRPTNSKDYSARMSVRTSERRLNQMSCDIPEFNMGLSVYNIERSKDDIKVYFNLATSSTDLSVYLDDVLLDSKKYGVLNWKLYVIVPLDTTKAIHKVHLFEWQRRSTDAYFDVLNAVNPSIERIDIWKNSVWWVNKIYWKNIETDYSKIKIIINWTSYPVSGNDYKKYVWTPTTIYWFHIYGDRYEILQPTVYSLTWENVIQIEVNGKKSNEMKFKLWKNKTIFSSSDVDVKAWNLWFNYVLPSTLTWGSTQNQEINLGTLNVLSGAWNSYFIEKLSFEFVMKKWDFLPVDYIKLKDNYGFIKAWSNWKYTVEFNGIYLDSITSSALNLGIRFSDNFTWTSLSFTPKSISYYMVNWLTSAVKFTTYSFSEPVSSIVFEQNYNDCFDTKSDYSNCKALWYKERFMKYSIAKWVQTLVPTVSTLDSSSKKKADSYIKKLDTLVEKYTKKLDVKTSATDYKKKLYARIYSIFNTKTAKFTGKSKLYRDYVKGVLTSKSK